MILAVVGLFDKNLEQELGVLCFSRVVVVGFGTEELFEERKIAKEDQKVCFYLFKGHLDW